ncbi:MAG TPA: hypothetical protein VD931_06225 [Baekduia sp.]|nr:hypothetical protein [Baekduia sp.]
MSDYRPDLVRDLGNGWTLRRWQYDGAPLELHGPGVRLELHPDRLVVEAEYRDYSSWAGPRTETVEHDVPVTMLRALLSDAGDDRGR